MYAKVLKITSEMAKLWLTTSQGNPRWAKQIVDIQRVNKIVDDILSGNWHPANNSIAFDDDGHLIDGHHRLAAIAKAGRTCESIVVYGVDTRGEKHIDEAATRTISQRLNIAAKIPSIANIHAAAHGADIRNSQSAEAVERFAKNHPMVNEAIRICVLGTPGGKSIARRASVMHAMLCAMERGVPVDALEKFAKIVNSGFSSYPNESAAIVLRNILLDMPKSRKNQVELSFIAQEAIYDFVNGVPRRKKYTNCKGKFM